MFLIGPGCGRRPIVVAAGSLLAAGALALSGVASGQERPAFSPYPGEFETRVELIELSVPGVPDSQMATLRAAFEEGANEPHGFCVTPAESHGDWLSDMLESDCTLMSHYTEGETAHLELSCRSDSSLDGSIPVAGTSRPDGADLVVDFAHALPGREPASVRMRVMSERIGECG